jgi:hypothetical protein
MFARRTIRAIVALVAPPIFVLLGVLGGLLSTSEPVRPAAPGLLAQVLLAIGTLGLLFRMVFSLVVLLGWRGSATYAKEIDGDRIVLEGVSPAFVDALREKDAGQEKSVLPQTTFSTTSLPPPPVVPERIPRYTSKLRQTGFGVIIIGVRVILLPFVGLQLRPFHHLGVYGPALGLALVLIGILIVVFAPRPEEPEQ